MKRAIFLMITVFTVGFSSSGLNAATLEVSTDCEDMAFDYADHVYEKSGGDGFEAGRAFEFAYALCEAAMN